MNNLITPHILERRCKHTFNLIIYFLLLGTLGFNTHAQAKTFGEPYKISHNLDIEDVHYYFQISLDGNYVVYRAGQSSNDTFELYSVPIDGSGTVKLNGTLPTDGTVQLIFQISPDSDYVVYTADQDTEDVEELYSSPIDGSAPFVKLNATLPNGGNPYGSDVSSHQISPDGNYVVYRATQDTSRVVELYSIVIDGSEPRVKLNAPLTTDGEVFSDYLISPDSNYVVYRAEQNTYQAEQDTDRVSELYSIAIDGSGPRVKLNESLPNGGKIYSFQVSPDGDYVIYQGDQDVYGIRELYSIPIDGSEPPVKLNETLTNGGAVYDHQISPDSDYVVYRADQVTEDVVELYSVAIDGSGPRTKLNSTPVTGGNVYKDYQISPDGNYVVYRADHDTGRDELYSSTIDGSITSVKLNGTLPTRQIGGITKVGGVFNGPKISPDGNYVVYRADQDTYGLEEIYSIAIDGSGPRVKLNGTSGDVSPTYQISPDSDYVVYSASQDSHKTELYGIAIDGSGNPVKINGLLPDSGNVHNNFYFSPDGDYLVYRADQDTEGVIELFSVRINDDDDSFCFPIKSSSNKIGFICL